MIMKTLKYFLLYSSFMPERYTCKLDGITAILGMYQTRSKNYTLLQVIYVIFL